MKLPKSFVVDRATWWRGESTDACLLNGDGARCCVGFLAKEMGVSDDSMLYQWVLEDVWRHASDADAIPGPLQPPPSSGTETGTIYLTNDDEDLTDEQREARLTALFADIGIEVRFEGEGNPVLGAGGE